MRSSTADGQRENPFDLTKASDYSDLQVKEYWVDVASGKHSLVEFINPTSLVPIFLLGGKGSGKTHLMRYCSSTVQGLRAETLRKALEQDKYLGVYTSADGLNVYRFSGKGQPDDVWETVFAYSFELWLVGCLLSSFRPALNESDHSSAAWIPVLVERVLALMQVPADASVSGMDGLISYLASLRSEVDVVVNNTALTRRLEGINVTFSPGDLVFGVPRIIAELCSFAEDLIVVYLIDEVENFTELQQRFLNTLVRYRKGNVTLRIGARLYGIKTYETLGSRELIKRHAEYEPVVLDARLREDSAQYESLAAKLVLRRLVATNLAPALTEEHLAKQFCELSSEDYFQRVALEIVSERDLAGAARPHLARFREAAATIFMDQSLVADLVECLEFKQHPLLEKVNFLAFYKRLSKGSDLLGLARGIKEESARLLQNGPNAAPAYYELYSHFSSDLLAQLSRDYGCKPIYAGFKTLVRLSQGVPRNLLGLLKHIYRRSAFAGEAPFAGGAISVEAQVQGVQDAAEWFWEDAQPDAHGSLVRTAVEHLATLFRSIRYSDSPSECDLCCFLVNPEMLTEKASQALRMAENWSFIVKVGGSSGAKNDDRVLQKFQVNPMLAARWGISESRRGSMELKASLAEAILAERNSAITQQAINARIGPMCLPGVLVSARSNGQGKLFDDL